MRDRRAAAGRRLRVVGWLSLLCLVVLLAGAGSAGAQEAGTANETDNATLANDTTAPEWVTARKAWPTEIRLRFTDANDISRDDITPSDFALSRGTVTNVSVESANGRNDSDVTVTLLLEARLDVDNITVSIAPDGAIADAAGNELTSGTRRVTGMDTLVPEFERFELTRVNESTVEVRLAANEPLTDVELAVTGPVEDRLNMTDFTAVDGTNTTFSTRYRVPEHGAYSFVWERAVDRHGNFRTMSRMRQFRYTDPAPDVVLDGPTETTVGTEVAFNASGTADEDGIDSYRWRIDGGTVLSGPAIRVAFATAGSHDITLAVTDDRGNTAVETRRLTVDRHVGRPGAVGLARANATHTTATVNGTGLVQQVRPANGSLVASDNVSLDRFDAAFPTNRTVSLNLRASDSPPPAFERPGFGLLDIAHDGPADRVRIRFGVDRASLNRSGVTPEAVVLYRDADGWTPLPTSVVTRSESRVVYEASSPGLSRFAVGAGGDRLVATGTPDSPEGGPATDAESGTVAMSQSNEQTPAADGEPAPTEDGPATAAEPTASGTAQPADSVSASTATNQSAGGSVLPGPVAGLVAVLPNPLALWPSGLVGTILGAVVGLVVVVYGVLKALAIYLGY